MYSIGHPVVGMMMIGVTYRGKQKYNFPLNHFYFFRWYYRQFYRHMTHTSLRSLQVLKRVESFSLFHSQLHQIFDIILGAHISLASHSASSWIHVVATILLKQVVYVHVASLGTPKARDRAAVHQQDLTDQVKGSSSSKFYKAVTYWTGTG